MYAHEVIDSLKKTLRTTKNQNEYHEQYHKLLPLINSSHKFHLGSVDKDDLINKYTGKQIFNDPEQKTIKFPYKNTWIDWDDNSNMSYSDDENKRIYVKKYGAHIYTLDKKYHNIFLYHYYEDMFRIFGSLSDKQWIQCPVFFNLYYNDERKNFFIHPGYMKPLESAPKESINALIQESSREFTVINMFLELLNCKNIGTVGNEPPEKLNKSRVKKGKQPLFTYKTLVIKPTSKRQQSLEAQGLWENRIHLCRGHFKEYSSDKPLFGKYTGRYWWQPSVRGRNTDGVVMKDYEVKAA